MRNIVIFGGGTGLSTLLKGIKEIPDINLQAIVTVADSGGSTGIIRKEYNIPAIGDIRKVLLSLANQESILNDLMHYRFSKHIVDATIGDHSLGNLIIYSLIDIKDDFYKGIQYLSEVFRITGEIIPLTDFAGCELKAIYEDGSFCIGESCIPNTKKKIKEITYCDIEKISVNPRAINAINEADIIVFSCGSLYTSIIANIVLPEIKEAILANRHKTFCYFCNIVTQPSETRAMEAIEHIQEIEKHLEYGIIDAIIMNDTLPDKALIEKYELSGSKLILPNERIQNSHCEIIAESLIDNNNHDNIRHDAKKIKKAFKLFLKGVN